MINLLFKDIITDVEGGKKCKKAFKLATDYFDTDVEHLRVSTYQLILPIEVKLFKLVAFSKSKTVICEELDYFMDLLNVICKVRNQTFDQIFTEGLYYIQGDTIKEITSEEIKPA